MRGLALQVQEALKRDPHAGDLYVFRGRNGSLIKIFWHDGVGMSLYAKRLERGRFVWPSAAAGVVSIAPSQLAYMLDGIDWRNPQHTWQLQMRDQRFRARQLGTRLNQRRLQRRRVLGKMIRRLSHDRDDSTVTPIRAINSVRRVNEPQLVQRSSGRRRPPGVLGIPPIDPVQHISELRRRDRYHAGRGRWPNKPATLQPLGVKRHANAVMPENLYQRTIAPPENVQIAGVRVALQRLLNLQGQAPHSAPHVGMAGRNPYPNPGRKRDHRAASALMTADTKSWGAVAAMRT